MDQPKFIITLEGIFRLGMVHMHKDLLQPGDDCIGGGYYRFDYASNIIVLDGLSYDFGSPDWYVLETLKVPSAYRGWQIVYKYGDDFHEDYNVTEELRIEYYD